MSTHDVTAVPNEHLDDTAYYQLSGFTPTRINGNLQADRSPDPYYDTFGDVGPYAGATTYRRAHEMDRRAHLRMRTAYRRPTAHMGIDPGRPLEWNSAVNLLGVLNSYGAVTNNQAAAFVGDPALADPCSNLVARLFVAGLLNLSPPYAGQSLGGAGGGTAAYQIGDRTGLRKLQGVLSTAEALAFSAARPVLDRSVHIRHDILAAELALRAAGLLEIGAVIGPQLCTFRDLTAACREPSRSNGGPDLTLVRDDGLRVAIEITASLGQRFTDKVGRWARILSAAPFETSGLVVVFLVAPAAASLGRRGDHHRARVYREVAKAAGEFPGSVRDRTAERIGIATWREWFPGPLVASERFGRLTVDRPTGRRPMWEQCHLWDPTERPLAPDCEDLRAVIKAAALLGQTPSWLRWQHHAAGLSADLLRRSCGAPGDVAPQRSRSGVRTVGAAHGAAAEALLPPRLVGPADHPTRVGRQPVIAATSLDPWLLAPPTFGHKLGRYQELPS